MEDNDTFYAHTPAQDRLEVWHLLSTHLSEVSLKAGLFASPFKCENLSVWIGFWHDAGKFSFRFQDYLKACYAAAMAGKKAPKADAPHAIHGAAYAFRLDHSIAAFIIACHHTGLQNCNDVIARLKPQSAAKEARGPIDPVIDVAVVYIPIVIPPVDLPEWLTLLPERDQSLATEFLTRMLFSCIVDADWLSTERHFHPEKSSLRLKGKPDWKTLWKKFEKAHDDVSADAPDTTVNHVRDEVYSECVSAGDEEQGVFRLTVPTGGGKTLSSLAFALHHAIKHNLDHIIVAIPYTSIIDQTADIYRSILGDENVLEHHSAVAIPENSNEQQDAVELRRSLLCENWDAPVIVTTTVQLFESLFSNRTSRCRKLHNISRSVLILDEVQTLPPNLLDPLVSSLQELTDHYSVTPVLCTATQPALESEGSRLHRLHGVRDIVRNYPYHFSALKRVDYDIVQEPKDWKEVANDIVAIDQVLMVLNTRKDALALIEAMGTSDDVFHLSTLLCGAHRRDVLAEVKERLGRGEPCKLISTQVIECGVDISFPVVYRAIAPLDRIAQSAGRCNRNGELSSRGVVRVFWPKEGSAPSGGYHTGITEAELILKEADADLHDPDLYVRYFKTLYSDVDTDERKVQIERMALNFANTAEKVKLISDDTTPVVVKYRVDKIDSLIEKAKHMGVVTPDVWHALQPYMVSLYNSDFGKAVNGSDVVEVVPSLYVWQGFYDKVRGIGGDNPDPADLVK